MAPIYAVPGLLKVPGTFIMILPISEALIFLFRVEKAFRDASKMQHKFETVLVIGIASTILVS